VDGIYIDITRQNCRAQDEANDSFYKRTLIYQLVFGFLYSDRVNYVMGLDYVY
jgi:hypothetical protein